jgi:phosphatidylserine/phosphatidylglycerophosphate/cardiolipin synthase-like enzyme
MATLFSDFVRTGTSNQAAALAGALEQGQITFASGVGDLRFHLKLTDDALRNVQQLIIESQELGFSEDQTALLLRSHLSLREALETEMTPTELVWTGDETGGIGVRTTMAVFSEMLNTAEKSVLIVAYSVWVGSGPGNLLIQKLAGLSSKGVDVTFVVDQRYQDGRNLLELRRAWPVKRRPPTVYSWKDEDDVIAKLHAKVVIVDNKDLLVTSANLTGHGLEGNLEFGLRVRGRTAAQAGDHFDRLLGSESFELVSW